MNMQPAATTHAFSFVVISIPMTSASGNASAISMALRTSIIRTFQGGAIKDYQIPDPVPMSSTAGLVPSVEHVSNLPMSSETSGG
jgi:hypothetical protein